MPPFKEEKQQRIVSAIAIVLGMIIVSLEGIIIPISAAIKLNGAMLGFFILLLGAIYFIEAS